MYLGVVRNSHFKIEKVKKYYNDCNDYPSATDSVGYVNIDLCNQNGKLINIFTSTREVLYQGDLVALDYVNGRWIVKEAINGVGFNRKKLAIFEIMQLEKLIKAEEIKLRAEKKEYDESHHIKNDLFSEIVWREGIIEELIKRFNASFNDINIKIEYIKIMKDTVFRQQVEFMEKIISSLRVNEINLFFWLMYANSILHLLNNNIDKELLIRAIELLLNVKIANNETNELKLQLEQQLKEKLNELKGKQKKLV